MRPWHVLTPAGAQRETISSQFEHVSANVQGTALTAVAFVMSDESKFTIGSELIIDGGINKRSVPIKCDGRVQCPQ
jgi:hypothetical protein